MTKRQLLDALAEFDDEQYIFVRCHMAGGPYPAVRLLLQGVSTVPAAHRPKPDLICLEVHEQNKELKIHQPA